MDTQEFEAGDTLNLHPVDMDGDVCASFLPEVHNQLFGFYGVESQVVVGAPHRQVLDLLSVGRLIVAAVCGRGLIASNVMHIVSDRWRLYFDSTVQAVFPGHLHEACH